MTLIGWELKKIIKRRLTRWVLAAAVGVVLLLALPMAFANYGFGTQVEAPTLEAAGLIRQMTRDAGAWSGPLTPETLLAAQTDCRAALAQGGDQSMDTLVQGDILRIAEPLFREAGVYTGQDWPARMTALSAETLAGFYDRRAEQLADRWADLPEAQRAALTALEAKVEKPFTYDWVPGHYQMLLLLNSVMLLVGLLLCAAVVPLFAGEVRTGVYALSHCARYGRAKLAAAKVAAALLFTGAAFAGVMALFVGIQLGAFGVRGLGASLQIENLFCAVPLTLGQTEALLLLGGLISCWAATALTAALSAAFRSEFPALVGVLAFLVALRVLLSSGVVGSVWDPLFQTLPFLTSAGEFSENTLLVLPGDRAVLAPFYRLAVQPLYLVVLLPLAGRRYSNRQVT